MTYKELQVHCQASHGCEECDVIKECDEMWNEIINNPIKIDGRIDMGDNSEIIKAK